MYGQPTTINKSLGDSLRGSVVHLSEQAPCYTLG
jgi:hypothetical protein